VKRIILLFSNLVFSATLAILLKNQWVTQRTITRKFIEWVFGRAIASHYHKVIGLYGDLYGAALDRGLDEAQILVRRPIKRIIDCGTGTGYVSEILSRRFPEATIISIDAVIPMLRAARSRFERAAVRGIIVCGDTSRLPLAAGSVDLVVAQNTTPFLEEFGRVCAPGGVVVFADSSATLITRIAVETLRKKAMFLEVKGSAAVSGFFVAGVRSDLI
jgi:ubiquinone/menaquinone biosynthesis C-methylase UbiE